MKTCARDKKSRASSPSGHIVENSAHIAQEFANFAAKRRKEDKSE